MNATAAAAPALPERVRELERIYRHIEATRLAGLGLTHPKLQVAAVGFAPEAAGGAIGVLVTPWFMNLVWLADAQPVAAPTGGAAAVAPPAPGGAAVPTVLRVGDSRPRHVGRDVIDFLGAFEEGFGAFETCSLFSPMFDFVDQAAALATAEEVLKLLRTPAPAADAALAAGQMTSPAHLPAASRREFLLGRRTA